MTEAVALTQTPAAAGKPGRRMALAALAAIGTINYLDRQILSVLAEPIRRELHLSDTQLGLLTGLTFAFFYAVMGVPAAMLADRVNRVRLVATACAIWSTFTGLCGFATTFWHLALARCGVGLGEAGGTAPSLSILADYFPPEKRPAVIGLFTVNGPLGVFLGATAGGWAAVQFGWRGAFFAVSGVGLVAAAILVLLVREPVRGALDPGYGQTPAQPMSLGASARLFLSRPTLRLLLAASGLAAFVSTGMLNWIPAYLMRVQGMPLTEVAKWFGPIAGLCMGVGIWGGGALVNWAGAKSPRAYAWIPGLSMLLTAATLALAVMAPSWPVSLALMTVPMLCCTVYVAPALALTQNLSPVAARATATSLILLAFNIVGAGGGPLAIGMMSDAFGAANAAEPLRLALLAVAPLAIVSALAYAALAGVVSEDIRKVQQENQP